jgi:hypothetical protein
MGPARTTEQRDAGAKAGLISRVTAALSRTGSELEARDLIADTGALGATPIGDLVDRSQATVCGVVRSLTLRPGVNVPALVAEISDGSQTLNLIWLGRRRIGGVVAGTHLSATGRVTYRRGVAMIFNPAYEIRPDRVH